MKRLLKVLKNTAISGIILILTYETNHILRFYLDVRSMVPMFYVLGVFIISLCTEGYFYGISASIASALMVYYMFYSENNEIVFTYNIVASAVIIMAVALITCTMTTYIKEARKNRAISYTEHLKADLMRAMSHDLRTPLTSIYGSSSAILDNYSVLTKEQRLDLVRDIKEESNGLIHMVENLLLITRISDREVTLTQTPTVLDELVDAVIIKFHKHFPEVRLEIDIPEEIVIIPMDPTLIQQVINNIIENAVFHAKGMTRVILKVTVSESKAYFEISDDGCGIPKEHHKTIFNGYIASVTEHRHITRHNMGIGLSVCSAIIKAHGGSIYAKNNDMGGASFCFDLRREKNDE